MSHKTVIFDLDDTLFDRIGQLDETYANINNIRPFPETINVLQNQHFKKILLSCGKPETQNKKIDVLKIRSYFAEIHITSTQEEKKTILEQIAKRIGTKNILVVGDRIDSEIRFGNMLGITTVRLLHGKYKDLKPKDDFEIPSFTIKKLSEVTPLCRQ